MTPEQEKFLIDFADKGLAEARDVELRNSTILTDIKVKEARDIAMAALKVQADALIASGLNDFETNVKPTII